ncbi:hypothetical protein L596_019371 [Steinernema carpocapsae]|uniref:G-protein coupled receptors family 1 profile domain-containing protein n=1 Tax=Steinernema carpocapsae TaxID=34508 RepID=A0A4U5MQA7_STECR|nr:hypothetical protein L596_019371 [Steinernema carpocapsae]
MQQASKLSGRGKQEELDVIAGSILLVISLFAVLLGCTNLYLIKKMKMFHNAFGRFAASRTLGEVGCNVCNLAYTVPITFIQPFMTTDTPGVSLFVVERVCGFSSCIIQLAISLNRFVAVALPLKYKIIFTKRNCVMVISYSWLLGVIIAMGYVVTPCSMSAIQNTGMLTAMVMVCFCQGDKIHSKEVNNVIIFDIYYVAHVSNALTMILVTPEIRQKMGISKFCSWIVQRSAKVTSVTPKRTVMATTVFGKNVESHNV